VATLILPWKSHLRMDPESFVWKRVVWIQGQQVSFERSYLKLSHDLFLQNPFQFFSNRVTIRRFACLTTISDTQTGINGQKQTSPDVIATTRKHAAIIHCEAGRSVQCHYVPSKSKVKQSKAKQSHPLNRPWRPLGLWDVKDPKLSRQSAHS
jgi:hypothetical protein